MSEKIDLVDRLRAENGRLKERIAYLEDWLEDRGFLNDLLQRKIAQLEGGNVGKPRRAKSKGGKVIAVKF